MLCGHAMMKKWVILFCALLFLSTGKATFASAESMTQIPHDLQEQANSENAELEPSASGAYDDIETLLDSLSIDELLDLQNAIEERLQGLGYRAYYDLERGAKGDDVVHVQERLSALGYYTGRFTGKFDSETQKAFKQFEKANGLENDGVASREDQTILFSSNAIEKAVTATPAPEKENSSSSEYSDYGKFDYEDCARFPEKHVGEKVALKCRVAQVIGSRTSGYELRVSIGGDYVYVDVPFDPGFNILENDRLTIYASMNGVKTYTSVLLQSITIPYVLAQALELR